MERNDWNNRSDNYNERNRYRGDENRADEDSYRGAYRFDTSSDHRNQTTWNGFGQSNDNNRRQGTDYNQDYNNDYNRNYNSDERRNRAEAVRDFDYTRDRRYQYQDDNENTRNWDEQYQPSSGGYGTSFGGGNSGSVRDRINDRDPYGAGNFDTDYRPDNFRNRGGDNSGNTAGSLSWGYDGGYNSDHDDQNRHYDPMSGQRRSYHGNYNSRHQKRDEYRGNRNNFDNDWL